MNALYMWILIISFVFGGFQQVSLLSGEAMAQQAPTNLFDMILKQGNPPPATDQEHRGQEKPKKHQTNQGHQTNQEYQAPPEQAPQSNAQQGEANPIGEALKIFQGIGAKPATEQQPGAQPQAQGDPQKKDSGQWDKALKILQGAGALATGIGGIDYQTERTIGESLALEGFYRYGLPVKNRELQKYVNLVGMAVARNSARPNIPYRFVVVDSPVYNAFACPGGIIFVSSALVGSLKNEAELASVLAHEVAHVSHQHALQSIRRAKFFEGVTKITAANMKGEKGQQFEQMIGDLQTTLFDRGLDKNMEFEADVSAMETVFRTGYDPAAMITVLEMLRQREAGAQKAGSWFSTHPPLGQRIQTCKNQIRNYPDTRDLATTSGRFGQYKGRLR